MMLAGRSWLWRRPAADAYDAGWAVVAFDRGPLLMLMMRAVRSWFGRRLEDDAK